MIKAKKGNSLIIAALIGAITAIAVIVGYKIVVPPDSGSGVTVPPSESIGTEKDPAAETPVNKNQNPENGATTTEPVKTGEPADASAPGETLPVTDLPPVEFVAYPPAADASNAAAASNKFAAELYAKYQTESSKNVFFSPYSIFAALEMTYEGARGTTADEIRSVFHFSQDNATRVGSFAKLYSQINPQKASYQLSTANALWAQKNYPFSAGYLKTVETYYGGKATNLDFVADTEDSRQTINKWVSSKTNDKIPELFAKGTITEYTRLVLTNAVYFKGKWATPFETDLTQEKDFTNATGSKVRAMMMNRRGDFDYVKTADYQAVEIPYQNGDLSMMVILPQAGKIAAVEKQLAASGIPAIKQSVGYGMTDIDLFLPKFKFDTSYGMNDTLSKMGMPTAFNPDNADFSGMYDRSAAGNENLYIGLVVHKAYVDVNEEGTEAAAATGVTMATTSIMEPAEPEVFNADHPFIFAIVHNETGSILFMGKVKDPTK